MNARDAEVSVEWTEHGTVRARHSGLPATWGEGSDETSARAALEMAIRVAQRGFSVGPGDPITLRYDSEGELDEIVTTRMIHLERMTDTSFYLGVGKLQVWLTIDELGRLVANYESNDEPVVIEPAHSLNASVPPAALRGMWPDQT